MPSLFQQLHDLRPRLVSSHAKAIAGVVLVTGCWQPPPIIITDVILKALAEDAFVGIHETQCLQIFSDMISIDDQTLQSDLEFGINHIKIISSSSASPTRRTRRKRTLPDSLPALAIVYQNRTMVESEWIFLDALFPFDLYSVVATDSVAYRRILLRPTVDMINQELLSPTKSLLWLDPTLPFLAPNTALRLFVAGDRSSVGKSSICLGLLGTLYRNTDTSKALDIAYIKPATQSESKQLIQEYCEHIGMECVPIGPLVYYRGFTRAYLAGQTSDASQLLEDCARAVNLIARGKDIVLIDGVGFPAVGSICGTSNAQVAEACRADAILLVGGPGVGAAVDAYNLNATFLAAQSSIPILGAVFNKLPTSGYYNLQDCREQVTLYFETYRQPQRAFGFVPVSDVLKYGMAHIEEYIQMFDSHVDVAGILTATKVAAAGQDRPTTAPMPPVHGQKRRKIIPIPTRHEIEEAAIAAGAAPSA